MVTYVHMPIDGYSADSGPQDYLEGTQRTVLAIKDHGKVSLCMHELACMNLHDNNQFYWI